MKSPGENPENDLPDLRPPIHPEAEISAIREQLLNRLLAVALVLGLPTLLILAIKPVTNRHWSMTLGYVCIYVIMLLITVFKKRLTFTRRATIGLGALFLMALLLLVRFGFYSAAPMYLIAFCVLATSILGMRMGLISLFICVLIFIGISAAVSHGFIEYDKPLMVDMNLGYPWIYIALLFTLGVGTMVVGPGHLEYRLLISLFRRHEQYQGLEDTHTRLSEEMEERKRAEKQIGDYQDQLRKLASRLTLAEQKERRRIAQLLHDEVGQSLASANLQLKMIRQETHDAEAASGLENTCNLVDRILSETRSLTMDLSPPVLYEMSTGDALKWLFEKYRDKGELLGDFQDASDGLQLSDDQKVLLFHVYRELLINLLKHADARRISGSLNYSDSALQLSLSDDGRGFDILKTAMSHDDADGFGLFSIHERLRNYHGKMTLESAPGEGTRATIHLPLT